MAANTGSGAVLPPGTLKPGSSIEPGVYEIRIENADPVGAEPKDGVYATCVYPDGWAKDHQVMPDDAAGLFEKVVGQLRGRFGAGEVKLVAAPKKVAAGATITVEI